MQHLTPAVPGVLPAEAHALVAGGALLVDVREQAEWDQGRIPDAVLRPMSQIEGWYRDLPLDRTIVVQCRTGVRSASVVAALIGQAGFTDVLNLTGGIVAWQIAGLPVEGLVAP